MEAYVLVAVALIVSFLTLFSMTKIWNQAFWKKAQPTNSSKATEAGSSRHPVLWYLLLLPIVILTLLIVSIGFATEPYLILVTRAAEQLLNPADYIQIVLGGNP